MSKHIIIITDEVHDPRAEAQRRFDAMPKVGNAAFDPGHVYTEEEVRAERRAKALESRFLRELLDACETQPQGALDKAAFTIHWPTIKRS